jgi:hypothetical protein
MMRMASIVAILLLGAATAPAVSADEITTYGVGLKSCRDYLQIRTEDNTVDQVVFIDWLSGYFSAVNKTSHHRNNFLGLGDLKDALSRIDDYCRARPLAPFAEAAAVMAFGARTGPAAHSIDASTYGSADKSCREYLAAREEQDPIDGAEFRDWLGGYLSGVNAISLDTNDVLGHTAMLDAVRWLDDWCSGHPVTSFGGAVEALVTVHRQQTLSRTAAVQLSTR